MRLTVVVSELSDRDHLSVSIKAPSSGIGRVEDCSTFLPDNGYDVTAMSDEEFLLFLMHQFQQEKKCNNCTHKDTDQKCKNLISE